MPVITISRQFGAGGKTLGEMIAGRLGYTFVNEDIIQKVAEKAKVSSDWVASIEKEAGSKLLNFMSSMIPKSYVDRVLGGEQGYIDEDIYVNALHDVLKQIAEEDNVVILGRGGQFILKDHPNAFHILLIAPLEDRIRFMETHYQLSHSEAARVVEVQGKRRANLYKKFGRQNYDHPGLYDAVLNMSLIDMEKAANFIQKIISHRFGAASDSR